MPDQIDSDTRAFSAELINEFDIPVMMQVACRQARRRNVFVIAAAIVGIRGVQRLMQIADEMQKELQGDNLLVGRCCRVGEFGAEGIDLVDNAVIPGTLGGRGRQAGFAGWPKQALSRSGPVDLDIHEMPLAGL